MSKTLLKGGQIVSSSGIEDANILIENGKIVEITDWGEDPEVDKVIDCTRKLILPGLIDSHVHLREPGQSYKEDWESGTSAAVAGGVTTVLDMPNNTPPIVTSEELEEKRDLIKGRAYCNYGLYIGFNGKNLEEINSSNAVAVKFFAGDSTGNMGVKDDLAIGEFFKKSKKLIVIHAEDFEELEKNSKKYLENISKEEKNNLSPNVHSKIRSPKCAAIAVRKFCELAKKTKARIHIAHVSTEEELKIINEYPDVTCEVSPHHLMFCDDDYSDFGNLLKVNPPLRGRTDIFALWKGLKFGEIDTIATDHAPHTLEEKEKTYSEAPAGIPELDTLGPLLFNAVNDEGLSMPEVVSLCCETPAKIFGLKGKGKLAKGFDADIVVVDMEMEKKVGKKSLFTKCGWSPYEGLNLKGWPIMTFINGKLIFENGEIAGDKGGKECLLR